MIFGKIKGVTIVLGLGCYNRKKEGMHINSTYNPVFCPVLEPNVMNNMSIVSTSTELHLTTYQSDPANFLSICLHLRFCPPRAPKLSEINCRVQLASWMNLQSGIIIMHDICRKISRKIIIHVSNYKTGGPIVGCFKRLGQSEMFEEKSWIYWKQTGVGVEPGTSGKKSLQNQKVKNWSLAYIFNVKGINSRIRTSDVLHHEDPEDHLPVVTKMNPIWFCHLTAPCASFSIFCPSSQNNLEVSCCYRYWMHPPQVLPIARFTSETRDEFCILRGCWVKDDFVRRVALQNSTKKKLRHSKRAKSTSSVDSSSESSSSETEDASPAASTLLNFLLFSCSFSCLNLAKMCL
jgi:hypothetical protein